MIAKKHHSGKSVNLAIRHKVSRLARIPSTLQSFLTATLYRSMRSFFCGGYLTLFMTCSCVQTGDGATSQNRQNTPDPSAITANMVPVNAPDSTFWIDRYENADLNRFTVTAPNLIPLTGLNIEEAKQRCRDQKKKLCTERQWLQACLGQRRDRFGYGQTSKEDQCNVNTSGVVPTGSKRRCRSDGQIYDMIGNVREWVDNDTTTLQAVSAGGSFRSGPSTNCFNRSITTTQARSQEVGFRCCLN